MVTSEEYFREMVNPDEMAVLAYKATVPELLEYAENAYPNMPAMGDGSGELTYTELGAAVRRKIGLLAEEGIAAGARVAVLATNSVHAMEWFLAIPASGRIVMMLPPALKDEPAKIAGLVCKCGLSAIVSEFEVEVAGVHVIDAAADSAQECSYAQVAPGDAGFIYLTGGTSGMPKAVLHSHAAIMRGAFNGVYGPGRVFNRRYLALLPFSHVFGSIRGFLTAVYTGSYVHASKDMKASLMQLPAVQPDALILVPGLLEVILGIAAAKGRGFLGKLDYVVTGAAPVNPALLTRCHELGINVTMGYGLTECANLTSGNNDVDTRPHSMGRIFPGQETRLVEGELWLRGDNVMIEYLGDPEATAAAFEDGWFKTGDLAQIDEEGYLTIVGRARNLIVLPNGENVSPEEIEELLYEHPVIRECVVREMLVGATPVVGVEVFTGTSDAADSVQKAIDAVNGVLPEYARIRTWVARTEPFPRTGAMKIVRD